MRGKRRAIAAAPREQRRPPRCRERGREHPPDFLRRSVDRRVGKERPRDRRRCRSGKTSGVLAVPGACNTVIPTPALALPEATRARNLQRGRRSKKRRRRKARLLVQQGVGNHHRLGHGEKLVRADRSAERGRAGEVYRNDKSAISSPSDYAL